MAEQNAFAGACIGLFTRLWAQLDQMTIDDPIAFTHPWKLTLHYTRAADLDRMLPWDCANDRNPVVNGKLSVAPP